jgi:hypothetical protein
LAKIPTGCSEPAPPIVKTPHHCFLEFLTFSKLPKNFADRIQSFAAWDKNVAQEGKYCDIWRDLSEILQLMKRVRPDWSIIQMEYKMIPA